MYWTLHYYHNPRNGNVVVTEGARDALSDAYALIGTHMYCEPIVLNRLLVGARHVFALEGKSGVGHYDVMHNGRTLLSIHEEPAVSADRDHEDADRDADARRAQAADEAHDAYMTRDRYYRR